jgi:type VI secretion system protein ImpC
MDYESNEPRVHLEAGDLQEPHRFRPSEDTPFCVAVLGDFSGRGATGAADAQQATRGPDWKPIRVTPDNMVELAGLHPRLELSLSGGQGDHLELEFGSLEDFHPDRLYRGVSLFAGLRDSRAAVKAGGKATLSFAGEIPDEAEAAAEEAVGRPAPSPAIPAGESRGSNEDILQAILGQAPAAKPPEAPADRELREFVREIVRPHLVRRSPDRSAELAAIDRAASALMRAVIHHRDFQALESLWRSVVFLLSRTDSSGKVRVFIVDVTKEELERDLLGAGDPSRSSLHELLAAPDLGAAASRWALAVGAYTFGASPDDALLEQVGAVARGSDVPWLSAGDSLLAGCTSLQASPDPRDWSASWEDEWARVPKSPGAQWLGLALPGFLVREPYGADTGRRCKAFAFEEDLDAAAVDLGAGREGRERSLLWGNPAFACAALLAQSFARSGWGFSPDSVLDLGQVPLARSTSKEERGPVITEAVLTRSGADRLAALGLMPLVAFPYEARIRVGGMRSIAAPPARLEAWWGG